MEYHELKNKELLDEISSLIDDDILEIHEKTKATYQLKNLMLSIMLLIDFPQDWDCVLWETYNSGAFLESMRAVKYKYITK